MGFLVWSLLRLITQRVLCKDVSERQQYQVAATEAVEGLLAQRVAAFEGGGESPIANRSSRMDGWIYGLH